MAKQDILQQIEEMSVKDLAELVEMIEERFGVSAAMAAPVAVAMAPAAGGGEAGAAPKAETYKVIMKSAGQKKIQVIKEIKDITGLGLKECKELADKVPATIKENVSPDEATSIKEKLEAAGAEIELE
ncbi:MAG: 50S ribosomal protein L7/L12 [Candidatus Bipolaricaulis sp.]|nr:50S ribosomal protein L7/L12 [Candidatus Bipolaricaulis sp.]MDD5218967.1 50S ribosomal protein L7/L12 [Candidatus Bipolaricaulis sp.]MDD5646020.1 50S ribosomal protein L7/L12 [Candidatus Bipolaricaulis sp.]